MVPLLFQSGYHPTLPPRSRERTIDGVYKLGWFNSNIRLRLLSAGLEGWPSINPGTVTRRGDAALSDAYKKSRFDSGVLHQAAY